MKLLITYFCLTLVASWFAFSSGRAWEQALIGDDNRILTKAVTNMSQEKERHLEENRTLREIIKRLEGQKMGRRE